MPQWVEQTLEGQPREGLHEVRGRSHVEVWTDEHWPLKRELAENWAETRKHRQGEANWPGQSRGLVLEILDRDLPNGSQTSLGAKVGQDGGPSLTTGKEHLSKNNEEPLCVSKSHTESGCLFKRGSDCQAPTSFGGLRLYLKGAWDLYLILLMPHPIYCRFSLFAVVLFYKAT